MAESMSGFTRSHRCTEVTNEQIGESVVLMGWVNKRRNLGSLIFVDLRDRSGLMQLLFDENNIGAEGFEFRFVVTRTISYLSRQIDIPHIKQLCINIVIQGSFTAHDVIYIIYVNLMYRLPVLY